MHAWRDAWLGRTLFNDFRKQQCQLTPLSPLFGSNTMVWEAGSILCGGAKRPHQS